MDDAFFCGEVWQHREGIATKYDVFLETGMIQKLQKVAGAHIQYRRGNL
ncbi:MULTISPECIES: hypothetical protein [Pigmentiphaga]|nr:hypothetical protein [Pigmentiphaga sp. D-2]